MEALNAPLYTAEGKSKGEIKLDSAVFSDKINTPSIYQSVKAYLANQRKGLASTKTRGEVSGGGRKPWKQKGTGRARVGSIRSPLWRHGGVTFGPLPRDFSVTLPKKIRNLALKSAISSKAKEENLLVLEGISLADHKTKNAAQLISNLHINIRKDKVLLLVDKIDDNARRAFANIGKLSVSIGKNTNAYEVMNADKLVVTQASLAELTERLKA